MAMGLRRSCFDNCRTTVVNVVCSDAIPTKIGDRGSVESTDLGSRLCHAQPVPADGLDVTSY